MKEALDFLHAIGLLAVYAFLPTFGILYTCIRMFLRDPGELGGPRFSVTFES
ncbi:MAG: hypothetical protein V2B15_08730 [Bacteroidota bacterium]